MRKTLVIGTMVFALLLLAGACAKKYDSVKIKGTMSSLKSAMIEANKFGNPITTDFVKAKAALQKVENSFVSLKGSKAPKGDQKEWDSIHDTCIAAAQNGIKACDAKDKKELAAALMELNTLMMKGHLKFRL